MMKVATWNVNGLRARMPRLQEWLKEQSPDVVCLQELKMETNQFPDLELRTLGYQAVVLGQPSWNGVAVLTKLTDTNGSAISLKRGIDVVPNAPDMGSRCVSAHLSLGALGPVEVMSVYVPNGKTISHEDFPRKLQWLDALASYLETRDASLPLIMGGDFNLCPRDLDSYDPQGMAGSIFHTKEERAVYARINAVYQDVHFVLKPDVQVFTWWDYRMGAFHKKQGLRIDMLFASPSLVPHTKDVLVDREYRKKSKEGSTPSDHAPVVMHLQ
jgi:exodeoxyribonuclease III